MASKTVWELPVPSGAILSGGPTFEVQPGRLLAIRFSFEADDDSVSINSLVFTGVEAYKCSYRYATDDSVLDSYDRVTDQGATAWLQEVRANLKRRGHDDGTLRHLRIHFDGGPTYEVLCRTFEVRQHSA